MDLELLKQFRTIAKFENLSRAAKELHVAQPSLSVAVRKMERELGVQLLERSKRGVKLTAEGLRFLNYCEQGLSAWDQIRLELNYLGSDVKGTLRVGCHSSVAIYTLPHFLPQLMSQHPALQVHLVHDLSRRLMHQIAEQELEVALIINPEPRPNLVVRPLVEDLVTVFRSPQLVNEDLLIHDVHLAQTQILLQRLQSAGLEFARTFQSSDLQVIAQLALRGLGHAILPQRVLTSVQQELFKVSFPSRIAPVRDRLALVFRPEFQRTPNGKIFIQAVRTWAKAAFAGG